MFIVLIQFSTPFEAFLENQMGREELVVFQTIPWRDRLIFEVDAFAISRATEGDRCQDLASNNDLQKVTLHES